MDPNISCVDLKDINKLDLWSRPEFKVSLICILSSRLARPPLVLKTKQNNKMNQHWHINKGNILHTPRPVREI